MGMGPQNPTKTLTHLVNLLGTPMGMGPQNPTKTLTHLVNLLGFQLFDLGPPLNDLDLNLVPHSIY